MLNNKYFLLRHGQTIYQDEGRNMIYPWPEPSPIILTEKGIATIGQSAKELKNKKIDLIYSSDVTRVRQSAEIVSREINKKIIFDTRLRDIDEGVFKGRSREEYSLFFLKPEEKLQKRPSQGESWNDVKKRMLDFLMEIDKKYKNKIILIVSHKGPLWLLEAAIKGLSDEEVLKLKEKGLSPGQFRELKNNYNL